MSNLLSNLRINDIIDILIVAVVFYKLFMLMKETKGRTVDKGNIYSCSFYQDN